MTVTRASLSMIIGFSVLLVILADRVLKGYAINEVALHGNGVAVLPGILRLRYTQNTGMSFSLLSGQPVLITLLSCAICIVLFYAIIRYKLTVLLKFAFGFTLGGALGNLLDRFMYGYVVDLFEFDFVRFAVFNLADASICVGVCLLIISILFIPDSWAKK